SRSCCAPRPRAATTSRRRSRRCATWAWRTSARPTRSSSAWASSSAWRSRAPWSPTRPSCWPTSPRATSTPTPRWRSSSSSTTSTCAARRCWWRRTPASSSTASSAARWCCATASWCATTPEAATRSEGRPPGRSSAKLRAPTIGGREARAPRALSAWPPRTSRRHLARHAGRPPPPLVALAVLGREAREGPGPDADHVEAQQVRPVPEEARWVRRQALPDVEEVPRGVVGPVAHERPGVDDQPRLALGGEDVAGVGVGDQQDVVRPGTRQFPPRRDALPHQAGVGPAGLLLRGDRAPAVDQLGEVPEGVPGTDRSPGAAEEAGQHAVALLGRTRPQAVSRDAALEQQGPALLVSREQPDRRVAVPEPQAGGLVAVLHEREPDLQHDGGAVPGLPRHHRGRVALVVEGSAEREPPAAGQLLHETRHRVEPSGPPRVRHDHHPHALRDQGRAGRGPREPPRRVTPARLLRSSFAHGRTPYTVRGVGAGGRHDPAQGRGGVRNPASGGQPARQVVGAPPILVVVAALRGV